MTPVNYSDIILAMPREAADYRMREPMTHVTILKAIEPSSTPIYNWAEKSGWPNSGFELITETAVRAQSPEDIIEAVSPGARKKLGELVMVWVNR